MVKAVEKGEKRTRGLEAGDAPEGVQQGGCAKLERERGQVSGRGTT